MNVARVTPEIIGCRFGHLTVLRLLEGQPYTARRCECRCTCGRLMTTVARRVIIGATASCGCLKLELASSLNVSHRASQTLEYRAWRSMWSRCRDAGNSAYPYYGGRGIRVCGRWADFEMFRSDIGACPPGCTLDRINSDGDYGPANCRWATRTQQARNTRKTRWITWAGQTLSLAEWAER